MQDRCTVCAKRTIGSKIVLNTPDGSPSDELKWKLISVHSEVVLILREDWCTVCAKRIVGSKIALDAPEVLLGDEARVKARFGLFGGSANLDTR
jgi:hypothetical protein